jgi:dTMP kinase
MNVTRYVRPPAPDPVFVVEGTDGSGKSTHVQLLAEFVRRQGREVAIFDFPQYGQPSARQVEAYLAGEYGELLGEEGARQASRYYANDRLAATPAMREALAAGKVVICNRYIASNLAHQGGKIEGNLARRQFYDWCEDLEYNQLGAVRPRITFVLHMPTEQAQQFVDQKADRAHLSGRRRDIHEADLGHLTSAARCYIELCDRFPDKYTLVECVDEDDRLMSIPEINERLRQHVTHYLTLDRRS